MFELLISLDSVEEAVLVEHYLNEAKMDDKLEYDFDTNLKGSELSVYLDSQEDLDHLRNHLLEAEEDLEFEFPLNIRDVNFA